MALWSQFSQISNILKKKKEKTKGKKNTKVYFKEIVSVTNLNSFSL